MMAATVPAAVTRRMAVAVAVAMTVPMSVVMIATTTLAIAVGMPLAGTGAAVEVTRKIGGRAVAEQCACQAGPTRIG